MMIKNQNFGIEIELTGITRQNAAKVIANYFGTTSRYLGSYYQVYGATDRKGRTWKAMSDGSIVCQVKRNGRIECAGPDYSCEIVSPILQYEDIEDLQNIVRELVKAGAMANTSCGIHVHVDGANHTPESLTRLLNFATGRQDLFYLLLFLAGALLLTVTSGCGLEKAMFEFASALGTVGLSIGLTGPMTNNATLIVEMVGMILGRLEIFIVLTGAYYGLLEIKKLSRTRR